MSEDFPPVRKEISVDAPVERAFRVFTSRIDLWWPREYQTGQKPMARVVLEPRAGGRWFEVDEEGTESDWGTVLVWIPPQRVVLGWQLDAEWKYDARLVTEVEVRFEAAGPMKTRVTLEHRNIERYGAGAAAARAALDSPGGWMKLLEAFATQVVAPSPVAM